MPSKKNKHMVKPGMHYATLVALIIANLTVLGLGILLANVLLKEGLVNIAQVGEQAKINKAEARIAQGREQVKMMKKDENQGGHGAGLRQIIYTGIIEYNNALPGDPFSDIAVGDTIYATQIIPTDIDIAGTPNIEWGSYNLYESMYIVTRSHSWTTLNNSLIRVHNALPGNDFINVEGNLYTSGGGVNLSAFSFKGGWSDPTILEDNGLVNINLNTDSISSSFTMSSLFTPTLNIGGSITHITVAI